MTTKSSNNVQVVDDFYKTRLVFFGRIEEECHLRMNHLAHACNPHTLGGRGRQITCGQEFETSLVNTVTPHFPKNTKN